MICRWQKQPRGLTLAALALLVVSTASATELSGSVDKVIDGDTFYVCDDAACSKIRLCGINAPERGKPGGQESTEFLKALVLKKFVRCVQVGKGTLCDGRSRSTSHDRFVAQCFLNGTDIAAILVKHGVACDWVKFSGGAYSEDSEAKRCRMRF